jgi:hypothetical protein
MLISTYFKEENNQSLRAEVVRDEKNNLRIDYYNFVGDKFHEEVYIGKSLQYVEDAAENWTLGIKQIYG